MHGLLVDHGVEGNQLVNVKGVAIRNADQVIDNDEARRPLRMRAMPIIDTRCTAWYIVRSTAAAHGQQRLLQWRLLGRQLVNVDEVAATELEAEQITKSHGTLARNQWRGHFGRAPRDCWKVEQSRQRCRRRGRQQHRGIRLAVERLSGWQSNSLIDPIVAVAAIIAHRSSCNYTTSLRDGMHLLVIFTRIESLNSTQQINHVITGFVVGSGTMVGSIPHLLDLARDMPAKSSDWTSAGSDWGRRSGAKCRTCVVCILRYSQLAFSAETEASSRWGRTSRARCSGRHRHQGSWSDCRTRSKRERGCPP
mmetsp:Transcript_3215/g.10730  ORF Transcript_3215/g.10730 Transcript_3215/m.10730 type:complete len:308 (-) Transcript_3215:251-1174(-)